MRHHSKLPVRRLAWLFALVAMLAAMAVPAAAQAGGSLLDPPGVMTRNLYLGADLNPALAALSCTPQPYCLLAANQGIWNKVVATDFPARAKKLAKEIDDNDPYMVGLQEVALWRSGPVDGVKDATTVQYDFLASLLNELAARGNHYKAAVVQQEADIESPSASPPTFADATDRRLTMRDVILVRTDLPKSIVSFDNAQSANYANVISVTVPQSSPCPGSSSCYGDIVFKRGWTSIDVKLLGHPLLRFVNTHLESAASGYRQAQAAELVGAYGTGPLRTSIPAILVGDFNSDPAIPFLGDPASSADDGAAFGIIAGAGFVETGNTANTFGHDGDLLDFPSNPFTERIDHVMTRPSTLGIWKTKVVGNDPANRAQSAAGLLWPSDHGGLVSTLGH